jgi:type II pantothenate kinase
MIGVDFGSTFTKVCIITEEEEEIFDYFPTKLEEIQKYFVHDSENRLTIPSKNIVAKGWKVTGGGSQRFRAFLESFEPKPEFVDEFSITAKGAMHIMKNPDAIHLYGEKKLEEKFLMISMGTGVSFTIIEPGKKRRHVGGSSLGGGALIGLSKLLLGIDNFEKLLELAEKGNTRTCDLFISDVYGNSYGSTLKEYVCASSFGKIATTDVKPSKEDIAASLMASICYSIGCQAAVACAGNNTSTVLFVGGFLSSFGFIPTALVESAKLYKPDVTVAIPDNSRYVGAIGCAL